MGHHLAGLVEHVASGEAALFHGGAGQGGEADDVAGGIDVRDGGLKILAHCQLAAAIRCKTGPFDIELVAIGLASDGVEQVLSANDFSAFQLGEDLVAPLVKANLHDLLAQAKDGPELAQLEGEALDDFAIDKLQQGGPQVKDRDLHAQSCKHGRVFNADNAGAHDNQLARNFFEAVDLIGVEDALAVDEYVIAVGGTGSAGDQDVLGVNQLYAVFVVNLDGVRVFEAGVAHESRHIVAAKLGFDDLDFAGHYRLRA